MAATGERSQPGWQSTAREQRVAAAPWRWYWEPPVLPDAALLR